MKKLSLKNSDNLTVDEAFEDFKGHCRIINLSGETIKLYQYQFNVFHRFLDDETLWLLLTALYWSYVPISMSVMM